MQKGVLAAPVRCLVSADMPDFLDTACNCRCSPWKHLDPDQSNSGRATYGFAGLVRGARALLLAPLLAILAVGGCETPAQQEASRIQGVATTDAPVVDACWRRAVSSSPYQSLKGKMGEHSDSPTQVMKLNPGKATPDEAAQILWLRRDYLTPCREIALESAAKVHPAIVEILVQNYAEADENYAKFTTGKISWGEFVTENQTLVTRRRAQLLAAGEGLQRTLGQARANEAANRQRADAALSAWARQQQILLPNQPVTSCRYVGSTLNCVTP